MKNKFNYHFKVTNNMYKMFGFKRKNKSDYRDFMFKLVGQLWIKSTFGQEFLSNYGGPPLNSLTLAKIRK